MNTEFDYSLVPSGYAHCFNASCPRGGECLRHLVALHAPKEKELVTCLNPAAYPKNAVQCPYYRSPAKVRLAWGTSVLCNQVPYGIGRGLMSSVRHSFSKATYYRILHHERPLSVEEQQMITNLFRRSGVETEPTYDYYTENYDWNR